MWMVWETGSKSLREIGELFGGLDYAAVAQRIRRTQVNLQSNRCAAADHHNVKCSDLTAIFRRVGSKTR